MYDLNETVAIIAFCSRVQNAKYAASFHKNWSKTLVNLAERVEKYVDTKEFLKNKNFHQIDEGFSKSKQKEDILEKDTSKRPQKGGQDPLPTTFTPLSWPTQKVIAASVV